MNKESLKAVEGTAAIIAAGSASHEKGVAFGVYQATLCSPRRREWYQAELAWLLHSLAMKADRLGIYNFLRRAADGRLLGIELNIRERLTRVQRGCLGRLSVEPFDVVWADTYPNLITTVGKNEMLDKYFAGSAYTAALNMFLKGTGSAAAGDTMSSHAGWSEVGGTNAPAYSGNRPAPAWSAASAGSKAISSAQNFTFTSGGTVAGSCFVQGGSATKDNTTGTLVSAGDFTGGSKTVANTDQLNVSWSISV